jgi:molybdopterin-synthase adenylyltransferase
MSTPKFSRPRVPTHYYIWFEPPDEAGDEILRFASTRRRIKLKGTAFREFQQRVIPLLDGGHTLADIQAQVADVFTSADIEAGLQLLADNNLLRDAAGLDLSDEARSRLTPQLNFFHEMEMNAEDIQARLKRARVTILGLGGAGAGTAQALAAAGVGQLRCLDAEKVAPADSYLSSVFSLSEVGDFRTDVLARRISATNPEVAVSTQTRLPENDDQVLQLINGSDFVLNCLDAGQSSLVYKLNRACLKANLRWSSCSVEGPEVVIGPTVVPFETACYLCYKMRSVACAGNPEEEFAFETFLDRRKRDDSAQRESLVFGIGVAANLLSLEAVKALSGVLTLSARGSLVVLDLLTLESTKHVVLRKPWCPACFKASGELTRTASVGGD